MDWEHPPSTMAEVCLWRVFCATTEGDIWQIIRRWIKKYGNPFKEHDPLSQEDQEKYNYYVEALRYTYINK